MVPLVDIGNRYAHIFIDNETITLEHSELFQKFAKEKIYYINVKHSLRAKLQEMDGWVDLEPFVTIKGSYEGMGIDRKVLLLSRGDGIYIDAGSAITIDKFEDSQFKGGAILPGIWIQKRSYSAISPRLEIDDLSRVDLDRLPQSSTQDAVSYGIIAPIIALVEKINRENLNIYCCGGDGELLASYIDGAIYNKALLFEGMLKVVKECRC